MRHDFFCAGISVALILGSSAISYAQDSSGLARAEAVLDYTSDDSSAADELFAALDSNAGQAVILTLEIMPKQDAEATGYSLNADGGEPSGDVSCGPTGTLGNVDNLATMYTLNFRHPLHFHSQVTVHIGDRIRFPFHQVWCGLEDYTSNDFTHLHVSGAFVVMIAGIPTAVTYDLYPYNP